MQKGKAPGPDALPAEFYQQFEGLIIGPLFQTIEESLAQGSLTEELREGVVLLLYKKGDPREIRNYRPITLLNVDYKIMAHALVARLKAVIDDIVSK